MEHLPTRREELTLQLEYWRERKVINERALVTAILEVGRIAMEIRELDNPTPPEPAT